MRMVLALLTSLRSFSSFWHGIARKRSLLVLRASVAIKSTKKAATMSRVFCTFFPQKGTQKSPADACAYFVPANVRNGRLFAGLQANRPRFLPLLAGTSFDGSASGRNRSRRNAARSWRNSQIGYAESCQPLEAGFNRRILAWSGTRTTSSPRKRHADGFGAFNFAALVFLLLARHSPQAVSARAACVGCHQKVV